MGRIGSNSVVRAATRALPARRRGTQAVVALTLAVACVLTLPAPAHAGWPLAARGSVALGFGGRYTVGSGSESTHRGIDITAEEGAGVLAPLAGRVTFVGRVPGASGGTVLVATLETDRGSITLLPLERASVTRGAQLAEGDAVGTLAAGGDPSSTETHLHVGVRVGDLYVDPLGVLMAPAAVSKPQPETQPEASQQDARQASGASAHPAHSGAHAAAHAGTGVGLQVRATPVAAGASAPTLRAAVPGSQLAAGVSIAGGAPVTAGGSVGANAGVQLAGTQARTGTTAAAQPGLQLSSLLGGASALASRAARVAGTAALGILAALGLLWPLWRRKRREGSVEVRVSPLGDDVAAAVGR